jgi:hypothetical protein
MGIYNALYIFNFFLLAFWLRRFLMDDETARTGAPTRSAATGKQLSCIFMKFGGKWKEKSGGNNGKNGLISIFRA